MTRAQQHLQLIVPQRFYVHRQQAFGDRHVYGSLTRFIPPELAPLFEQIGPQASGEPYDAQKTSPLLDVSATIRSFWA